MDSELVCPVCQDVYTKDTREPVSLPSCGHTFCRSCLCNVEKVGKVDCPTCRKPHFGPSVSCLPTIFALLSLSEKYKKPCANETPCSRHGSPLEFWCRRCQEALCGNCLLAGHLRDGHIVERGKVFVAEKKQEILSGITRLVRDIDVKKELIIKQIAELISQVALNTEESQILHNTKTEADKLLKDISSVTCIESALTSLVIVDSLQTGTQNIPLLARSRVNESNICNKCTSSNNTENITCHAIRASEVSHPVDDVTEDTREGMDTEPQSPLERDSPEAFKGLICESTDKCFGEQQISASSPDQECSRNDAVNLSNVPTKALRTKATWPLHCCVLTNDNRKGKLRWENEKLHMYSLTKMNFEAQFMIQLSIVEWLISADSPEVFLDLGTDHHHLGRVYIRLYGHLRRAQHFLALCLGSFGPSYKYSKFHGVAKRGAPGETLAGGKYINSQNTLSIQGLISGLEWGAHHIREKKEGLVVGASGGKPYQDAFFHICTKDHPGKKFACVFGEVVSGMQVLREAIQHMVRFDVMITEVGVILSQNSKL